MAIEKSLYGAPQGEPLDEEQLELDVEMPDESDENVIELLDGGVEITLVPDVASIENDFSDNLAEKLDDDELLLISNDIMELVEADIVARSDWADTYIMGLDVLGMKYEERSEPWDGACGTYSTVLAEAAIRFQAETMSETFPASGPVKTKIIGEETAEKTEAAERVSADMNYELTEQMVEYRPEHERMLYSLGLAGSAFKKIYKDPGMGRQVAMFVNAEDMVVPYGASHIETAERVTHIMRKTKNDIAKLQASGFYRDVDLGDPVAYHSDIDKKKAEDGGIDLNEDDRYALFEVHIDYIIPGVDDACDCEEEGCDCKDIAKPYVITIDKGTDEIVAIYRNWDEQDELRLKQQHFVHYAYVPGFGFYGMGLIHIIGGYAKTGTSLIRQLVDAGTLANLPGGLKTRGLRIKNDDEAINPGEFKDVDVLAGSIKDNIMTLPYKEPSQTLLALLERITTEGRRLGAISDMDVSDMSTNAPVGTTLALLERTLKPMAAVQARTHYSMKAEFKLLKKLMAEFAPDEYGYKPYRGEISAKASDYDEVEIIPVSDPNSATMAQKVIQYQTAMQMAKDAPQIYDQRVLHRQMLDVIGIPNTDKIVPIPDDMTPADPVSENMEALIGKPTKAFIYQDHDAHIATHMSFMQDPQIAQMIGQNPAAQRIMSSLQAHIAEHLGFSYRRKMEEKLGAGLPAPNAELPEEIEVTLSQLVAKAGTQLTQQHQKEAAQKEAQKKAQDPVFQMNQQKTQNETAEVQRKQQKDQADLQIKAKETQLKEREQLRKERKDATDADMDEKELQLDAQEMGLKIKDNKQRSTLDRAKHNSDMEIKALEQFGGDNKGGDPKK